MKSIIMAGGSGTRLWPFSRKSFPKQFLSLLGEDSFIEITTKRLMQFTAPEAVYVVAGGEYEFNISDHMSRALKREFNNLILEPMGRNTAPAIALTVKYLLDKAGADRDDIVFFSPSDHIIRPETELKKAIEDAKESARSHIVTFGIVPSKPETGYGYIELGDAAKGEIFKVKRFVEKPDRLTAEKYLQAGNYMWNSGMFLFSIGVILDAFKLYVPELYEMVTAWSYDEALEKYSTLASISIDYAVMEKAKNILCRKVDVVWNDIGSWESLYDLLPKDDNGNAVLGEAELLNTKNSLVITNKTLTALVGMDNTAVIATEDAILVTHRKDTQRIKELVDQMKVKNRPQVTEHVTTYRPWGSYTILEEGLRYKIKRLVVLPERTLSLQRHKHRSEHWVVVKGMAEVLIGEKAVVLHENESIYVPIYEKHRLANPGKIPLEIIEVQNGEYVGEDDIERFEDIYGRV
ncbi:MAG: mannose-1-phosphate guanylyltransferase/mannose-6-phosphate isomerase [Spirochaetes bacterium GWF1_51_8]|nr:MAG: mannose-1-phosphate guanylyltransferase/mannose-6-phosphate isomerase [Spirochaetes bacterium GWF1_51_8]